eukprot:m.712801 g.712801  ORF g.712801 m.712801 type:complete len:55 (-) comp58779_c0_seq5:645-809(-)
MRERLVAQDSSLLTALAGLALTSASDEILRLLRGLYSAIDEFVSVANETAAGPP